MVRFPDPVRLPSSIDVERKNRQKHILSSTTTGILIRLAIIGMELSGVVLFGSAALLMDALASFVDVLFSVFLLIGIRMAGKPPDEEHPFGHGRYEPLAGLQLALILSLFGFGMIVQQIIQLNAHADPIPIDPKTWIFPFIAVILLESCYRIVMHAAKVRHSPALAADAYHYRIDGVTSLFATIALALAAYYPEWGLTFDHLGAILIAGLMIGMGLYSAKENLNQLMDRIPNASYFETVRQSALAVEGVKDTEKIRIQFYGPDAHVDIDIEVDPQLTVEVAHRISQNVRAEIQKRWPAVRDATVHIEPFYPNDHTR